MPLKAGKNIAYNCYVNYVKIETPALIWGEKEVKDKPWVNKEYSVDVLVTEEDYKALRKKYKTVASIKNVEPLSAQEYQDKFRVAPPFEAEEYFVIKFKKKAFYTRDDSESPKPLLNGATRNGLDRNGVSVIGKSIANGSLANVQWKERPWEHNGKKGMSLDLFWSTSSRAYRIPS